MKRIYAVAGSMLIVVGSGVFWPGCRGGGAKPEDEKAATEKADAEKPAGETTGKSRVARDEKGRAVVRMEESIQKSAGLVVAKAVAAKLQPEWKGYGRVLDPAALAALVTELAAAQAAQSASSNELVRLKTLAAQGNAPERALQNGEATALRDQFAVQSARDRLALTWGRSLAERTNLTAFVESLASLRMALVRVDLSAGETLPSPPVGARLTTLSGESMTAEFLGAPANIDPQTQGQGFIFLAKAVSPALLPGQAVTGYLQIPGPPLTGVEIPREAVVRTEGAGWVYVLSGGSETFTRTPIKLDHPTEGGWFIAEGLGPNDSVVVRGAQTLLSEELKGTIQTE